VSDSTLDPEVARALAAWRGAGERIVFTNGVFDLIHRGHVEYLGTAREQGDRLIVGINSDASVRRLKGAERPIVPEADRLAVVRALRSVDRAVLFDADTPEALIREVRPDVLVKGGDWSVERIVGRAFVESYGGLVLSVPVREGSSTSALVERIRSGRAAL
jgi:rfaE bifunctional protein nucleotidyltransferase chain/domain